MSEIVNGNSLNETHAHERRSRSTFPLKQMILDTHRFGEYHPHFFLDGVTSDNLPIRSSHKTMSYTLKAPLMQDVFCNKDYFQVPLRAILPFNADKIVTNPTQGDDVPQDSYTSVDRYPYYLDLLFKSLSGYVQASATATAADFVTNTKFFKLLVIAEAIVSNGSLSASLGANFSGRFSFCASNKVYDIDAFFDLVCSRFISGALPTSGDYVSAMIDNTQYQVYRAIDLSKERSPFVLSFREFLEKIRDTSDWEFTFQSTAFNLYTSFGYATDDTSPYSGYIPSNDEMPFDLAPLWSYQLVCAEFFTNSHVDYIYSAELFREYIFSLTQASQQTFTLNGVLCPYDHLSAHTFTTVRYRLSTALSSNDYTKIVPLMQYFLSLYGYKRSLRYKDYFTGSRPFPLAVGDTNIPVTGTNVSVVDVSRGIQLQRFLNTVNAAGRKFEEYLKGIFGVAPAPDMHNPLFLAHSSDSLFAQEVENTGEAQMARANSVTAVFRGNSSNYEYRVELTEPSFIIGITSYDIERAYTGGVDRLFFKKDRFDMFLPDLQFVGDQPVYKAELYAGSFEPLKPFGYQFRDMQYKQLVNRASGGFATGSLPGYAFLAPRVAFFSNNISPDFIRSAPHELDDFYSHLTGYSLGTYFHFIVLLNNTSDASRPMAVNPQILQ